MSTIHTNPLEAAAAEAAAAVERLARELSAARKLAGFLQQLIAYRDKDWPVHIKALCEKEKTFLADLRKREHPAITPVEELYRDAKERAAKAVGNLPKDLLKLAKEAGIPLDTGQSRHPIYYFLRDQFVVVEIDDKKQTATVGNRENKGMTVPADAGAVLEAVGSEQSRLFERDLNGAEFLATIYKAYRQILKKEKAREGDPVPLRAIYQLCADERKDSKTPKYQPDEFLIDMSVLTERGPGVIDGLAFSLQQTKDTEQGILLIGPAGRGMVSLIRFHPKENPDHE